MNQRGFTALSLTLAVLVAPGLVFGVATLKPLKGSVYVQHPGKDLWEPVKTTAAVDEGDHIKTSIDSRAFMTLEDGHKVAIGPDSYLTLQRLRQGETKFFLKTGAVRNKVKKLQTDLGQYYKVQTPSAVCAVRGTDFLASFRGHQTLVTTYEGTVSFGKKEAEAILVSAGQTAMAGVNQTQMMRHTEPSQGQPSEQPKSEKPDTADSASGDQPQEPKGPPPGGPGEGQGPRLDWDHPENWSTQGHDPFNHTYMPEGSDGASGTGPNGPYPGGPMGPYATDPHGEPNTAEGREGMEGPYGPYTAFDPLSGTGFGEFGTFGGDPYGGYDTTNSGYPPIPPTGTGGENYFDPNLVGIDALVNTLNNQALYDQAQAIQIADLFKMDAVKMDPATGQLRQFADAVLSVGPDAIKFVNANMIPGQPDTLNYASTLTRFNTTLPATYTDATKIAFSAGTAPPPYHAIEYHSDMSNTVDHVFVDAIGGASLPDTGGIYRTVFNDMSARIVNPNGVFSLWSKSGSTLNYLGGAAPTKSFFNSGCADHEVKDTYLTGDFFAVHTTFSDGNNPYPASLSDRPSSMQTAEYLDTLFARTTLVSNLFIRGPITVFGSVRARTLAGMYAITNADATGILNGTQSPNGAPLGLSPT